MNGVTQTWGKCRNKWDGVMLLNYEWVHGKFILQW